MATTQIRGKQILDNDITSDDIADGAVRGSTSNSGTQQEISQGTISTLDLRNDAVSAIKLLSTDSFSMGGLTIGGSPVTNAILTLTSTTQAFVPPRMTTTQRNNISSPSAGMLIFNSTSSTLNIYTTSWGELAVTETDPLSLHINGDNSPSVNINWNQKQILNLVVEKGASEPISPSPVEGQIFYRTDTHQWEGYNGTNWVILG